MLKRASLVALALLVVAGTSCGSDHDGDATPATTTTEAASFPVTVATDKGDVTIVSQPRRIVSLSPSLTEILYALKAGEQVVAVDKNSDYPAGTPKTDLSGFRHNVEAVAGQRPDLVVLASDRDGAADRIAALDIPVLLLSSAKALTDVYEQIDALGAATGHPTEARKLAAGMKRDIAAINASVPERKEPVRYFYELSDGLDTVTSKTFVGELLAGVGLTNIADTADPAAGPYPKLSNEYVISADPAVIFLAHTDGSVPDAAAVAARPGWSGVAAVRDGHVVALPVDVASRWGPRIVQLLRSVVDATERVGT